MMREAIATAETIDEARELARVELGAPDEADVGFDIIDLPEKKVLGLFGGKLARVRAYFDDGKPEPKPKAKAVKAAAPKAEKPTAARESVKKAENPATAKPAEKKQEKVCINSEAVERAVEYTRAILKNMNVGEYTLEVKDIDGGFCISLAGDGLGAVIGRRGETLDAIQYLVSLNYNNSESNFVRVALDANDYRAKREVTLSELAAKVAKQVLEGGRNQSLEPMNPYERRIIHTAIQEIDGVTSWSVSDGQNRRVIIGAAKEDGTPVDPDYKPMRRVSGRRDSRRRDSGRGRRDSRPTSNVVNTAPKREKISDAGDLPLFGRVDK